MHYFTSNTIMALAVVAALTGCKVVKNPDQSSDTETAIEETDAVRMARYAEDIWETDVLPAVAAHLVPLPELRASLGQDVDAAGAAHGLRPDGEANPWNFAVSGSGIIVEAKTESRAAKLQLDTDADGTTDVTLQLGPVVRGTSIRDAMPFLTFSDFRDQIEFAKLANGLNAAAHARLTIPDGDLLGQTVTFEGVFTFKDLTSTPEIVPTALQIGAP